ncbi:hypothetical protein [Bacillus paranthracis]|uniref:hypothetical protein n=1 Tax=Bacillus paranthracis TaxID=2026186 RepID=UPI0007AB6234|nr:hypothetical protein B4085_1502 [Bacillus cereus]KZD58806.1 hypothetical protein B4116_4056 [Bacillus cereus]
MTELEKLKHENERMVRENKMYRKWINELQCNKDTLNHKIERITEFTNSKKGTVFFAKDQKINQDFIQKFHFVEKEDVKCTLLIKKKI